MNRLKHLCILLLLLTAGFAQAQNLDPFERHLLIEGRDTLPYRLLLPENYDASKKYPLVFFLHGAGERGNDNQKQLTHGARMFLADSVRKQYPAIVVFPQCPANSYWSNVNIVPVDGKRTFNFRVGGEPTVAMSMALRLLKKIRNEYPVKKDQLYVGGLSMGGMGTFEMVRRNRKLFAAAFPICGGANPETARKMRKTKFWIFHGAKDDIVLPSHSQHMVEALKAAGAEVRFTLYPNANHNSWDPAFREPGILAWLFAQHK
jgi:predicted peptidase